MDSSGRSCPTETITMGSRRRAEAYEDVRNRFKDVREKLARNEFDVEVNTLVGHQRPLRLTFVDDE